VSVQFAIGNLMRDADELLGLLRSGAVDPTVVASETVTLDEAPEAYRRMAERRSLKTLIST
jgi:threonine dehydrogenase-like Zn-dependent dehydrogenase